MLKPLGDRIVVKVIEDTEQTSGGIFIPDSAKEKPQKGEVVAVGLGKMNDKGEREPMDVAVGQTVLYAKYAGTDVKMDGNEYKILSIKDALAIIEQWISRAVADKVRAAPVSVLPLDYWKAKEECEQNVTPGKPGIIQDKDFD